MTRNDCLDRDERDDLAPLRGQFDLPDGVIYLNGNSLGPRPRAALARSHALLRDEWGQGLVRSWNDAGWFDMPRRLGNRLAPLIGAHDGEVVVTDSTSINLFKALAGALRMQEADSQRRVIVTERANFPTDIYMAQTMAAWLARGYSVRLVDAPDELPAALDEHCAVLMLTHVNYRTGYQHDMAALGELAHAKGALMLWDLAHSVGAVELDVQRDGADLAVGCTYKYLNGGPGAPGFIWVPHRHQERFYQPLSGWWSHAAPFAMAPDYVPADGIARALSSTQPIVSLALVECGLAVFERASMAALRAKSLALTDLFIDLLAERCGPHALTLVTPREHARRGSHVSVTHPHGFAVMQALIGHGVIGDYREPHIMRFGFAPLYTRFVDVWDAVETLRRILDDKAYDTSARRGAVT